MPSWQKFGPSAARSSKLLREKKHILIFYFFKFQTFWFINGAKVVFNCTSKQNTYSAVQNLQVANLSLIAGICVTYNKVSVNFIYYSYYFI